MKTSGTLAAIVVLSLAAWLGFRLFVPGPPLEAGETMILVGACAAVVLGVRWVRGRLRKPRGSDEPTS